MNGFVGIPQLGVRSTARRPCNTPTCSAVTRRTALQLACLTVSAALLPQRSNATSLNEKAVLANMKKVSLARGKADNLKGSVEQWKEPWTEDDTLYILRYIPLWLEPGRVAMAAVASQKEVDVGDRGNAHQFADLLHGHLFELKEEARSRRKDGVIRELDEFVETADAFLSIPELQKLKKRSG